jgi:hypothetical protein
VSVESPGSSYRLVIERKEGSRLFKRDPRRETVVVFVSEASGWLSCGPSLDELLPIFVVVCGSLGKADRISISARRAYNLIWRCALGCLIVVLEMPSEVRCPRITCEGNMLLVQSHGWA